MRNRRRIIEATALAAALSGTPSTLDALARGRSARALVDHLRKATCAAATLIPPGRPSFARGTLMHVAFSAMYGEALARTLPERHSVPLAAVYGLATGIVNIAVIGRRYPAIRTLPLLPQIADHVAFGVVFAMVVDGQTRNGGLPEQVAPTSPECRIRNRVFPVTARSRFR
jgi:hypothetical protein